MKTYKLWKDFETNAMNEQDLLKFALDLWRDGCIEITSHWDEETQKTITRYSIIATVDE
jgi:hypothetical protein